MTSVFHSCPQNFFCENYSYSFGISLHNSMVHGWAPASLLAANHSSSFHHSALLKEQFSWRKIARFHLCVPHKYYHQGVSKSFSKKWSYLLWDLWAQLIITGLQVWCLFNCTNVPLLVNLRFSAPFNNHALLILKMILVQKLKWCVKQMLV